MSNQNQMVEALAGLMNQSQGETIDVPHPTEIKDVRVVPLNADWHNSALKADSEKDDDGDRQFNIVKGRICEITHMDEYGEPLGEARLILQHKYGTPTRQSKDISATAIKPDVVRSLKARFPTAFAEMETKLLREGRELPIVLLDNVPPEVVQVIYAMGIRTVRQFAEFDEAQTEALVAKLQQFKMASRVNYVPDYLKRARDLTPTASTAKRAKAA